MQTYFWRFLEAGAAQPEALTARYSLVLVLLSFAVATLAGYTALRVRERMRAAPTARVRGAWLGLGALAMGSGIWAMHFIGMLAFSLRVDISYDLEITLASLLPGIFASAMALHFMDRSEISITQVNLGGLMMALGIGGMHFLGMEAMRMDARMGYVPLLFGLSIVVAHVLATAALYVQFALFKAHASGSHLRTAAGAALLGAAVGCMHYTAMSASRFFPAGGLVAPSLIIPPLWLAVAITVVSGVILGLAIVSTFVDRHLAAVSSSLDEAQQRARHIIDASPEAIVSMDEKGAIVDWNEQAEEIFGWTHAEVVGKRVADVIIPERHRAEQTAAVERVVAAGSAESVAVRMDMEALRRDGTEFPVEISVSGLRIDDRCLFIAFLHDISERIAARAAREEATRQAQEAARAKGDFLANMSHEIRTPMNGVIGMTQILLDTDLTPEQREYAETVKNSGESLLAIINDILDFSKVEAGRVTLECIDFDVRTCVEEVTKMLAHQAEEAGIELMCSVNAAVPRLVGGDPARLRQVLVNLLNNAIKFTAVGEVVVGVDVVRNEGDQVVLAFEVTDTGIGIPQDRLEAVFDSFTQADSTTTRTHGGTGLGLAIAKQLVELMDGSVRVESEPGEGSTFSFTVTLERRADQPEPRRATSVNGRVFIVDDNATNRRILRAQLRSFGLQHEEAEDADSALALLRAEAAAGRKFDVGLLDYQMPGMDGQELGRLIRADPALAELPLVMLTSVGRRGDAARYADLGFAAYLVKPIQQSYLFDCLVTILSRDAPQVDEPRAPLITRHTLHEGRRRNEITILVAEDNVVNQRVAQALIKKFGYLSEVAADGADAVAAVQTGRYRMVLMDCQMPNVDGFEATRRIRDLEGNVGRVPIVAMTANALAGDRERCLEAGMDDYVAKPIDADDLKNAIHRALLLDVTKEQETSTKA